MGRNACEQGPWSENSLVWKQDTDLGGRKAISSYLLVSQEMSQQDVTTLGLLRCSVRHIATVLRAPVAPEEVAGGGGPSSHSSLPPKCSLCCLRELLS